MPDATAITIGWGLIAGNGRFPFLVLEGARSQGIEMAVMAGQVKHNKIFSAIRPDWKLAKLLFSLPRKSTDALIGGIARVLMDEGIQLVDSTLFLKPLLPEPGVLTRRAP